MKQKGRQLLLGRHARLAKLHIERHDALSEGCEHHYGGNGNHKCAKNLAECDVRVCPLAEEA